MIGKPPFETPSEVTEAISKIKEVSESISGHGESQILRTITHNIGVINGGVSPNLIPKEASAKCDIRLPVGVSVAQVETHLEKNLGSMKGISWTTLQKYEPTWTSTSEMIVQSAMRASEDVLRPSDLKPVANMRVGGSDTRIFRLAGIQMYPFGMGAEDEYVLLEELLQVAQIQALTAYEFLR